MNGNARLDDSPPADEPTPDGMEARKRAIARAVWTEIHWLMPRDRTVEIAIDGEAIAVEFGPPGRAPQAPPAPSGTAEPVHFHRSRP